MADDRSEHELGRMLAKGRPGGPELDALWDRVDHTLSTDDARSTVQAERAWWSRTRGAWLALPVLVAGGAAAALLLMPRTGEVPAGFTARGTAPTVVLEASCGANATPCRVGDRVSLRLHGGERSAWVEVALAGPTGEEKVAGPFHLQAGETKALPVALEVESDDVAAGITVVVATSDGERGVEGLQGPHGTRSLTLRVQPAAGGP